MNKRIILVVIYFFSCVSAIACRYTIREIGFSTLSKVTYAVYRIDDNGIEFPHQQAQYFTSSNIRPLALNLNNDADNPVVAFVKSQQSKLPAYVLVDPSNRMLILSSDEYKNSIHSKVLNSPLQQKLINDLPDIYATVILINGIDDSENSIAHKTILNACKRIENIMPNMPKLVENGPNLSVISSENFHEEKTLLWSLGVEEVPTEPIAFIVYGRGRIMGEKIDYSSIKGDNIYKLLSIIGADCECGLDRKWMLGYQIPLPWPKKVTQHLSNLLGFDVDNPMILAEMSRILAIENKVPKDPDGISFEPLEINLDDEFNDIPEIEHRETNKEAEATGESSGNVIWYSLIALIALIAVGVVFVLKKNKSA